MRFWHQPRNVCIIQVRQCESLFFSSHRCEVQHRFRAVRCVRKEKDINHCHAAPGDIDSDEEHFAFAGAAGKLVGIDIGIAS